MVTLGFKRHPCRVSKQQGGLYFKRKYSSMPSSSSQWKVTRPGPPVSFINDVLDLFIFFALLNSWKDAFKLKVWTLSKNRWRTDMRKTRGCCWGRGARRVTACHSHCLRTGPRPAYLSTCTSAPATMLPAWPACRQPDIELHWMHLPPFVLWVLYIMCLMIYTLKGTYYQFFFLVRVKDLKS